MEFVLLLQTGESCFFSWFQRHFKLQTLLTNSWRSKLDFFFIHPVDNKNT